MHWIIHSLQIDMNVENFLIESQNNLGWNKPLESYQSNPSAMGQRHFSLVQVAWIPIQTDLEYFLGMVTNSFFYQSVQFFHHPYNKKYFPYI